MAAPTIVDTLKLVAPAFVRKLRRASDWAQADLAREERPKTAVRQVFRNQSAPEISVYLVHTDEDLRRVAIGMNANRDSLRETIAFIAFLPAELTAAGIQAPTSTLGDLKCDHANRLHHDVTATDAQLEGLWEQLIKLGRAPARCTAAMMKDAGKLARDESCKSIPNVSVCGVSACNTAGMTQDVGQ